MKKLLALAAGLLLLLTAVACSGESDRTVVEQAVSCSVVNGSDLEVNVRLIGFDDTVDLIVSNPNFNRSKAEKLRDKECGEQNARLNPPTPDRCAAYNQWVADSKRRIDSVGREHGWRSDEYGNARRQREAERERRLIYQPFCR